MEMTQHTSGDAAVPGQELTAKYLTFILQEEVYAIEIVKVQEIIGMMSITKVPRMPSYVRGVINLRGRIIPTISLRSVFRLPAVEESSRNCIIVMDVNGANGRISLGVIVDEVADVIDIELDQIDRSANLEGGINNECLVGFAVIDETVKTMLDVDKIMSGAELNDLDTVGAEAKAEASIKAEASAKAAEKTKAKAKAKAKAAIKAKVEAARKA